MRPRSACQGPMFPGFWVSVGDQQPREQSGAACDKLRLQWWTRAVREGRGVGGTQGIGLGLQATCGAASLVAISQQDPDDLEREWSFSDLFLVWESPGKSSPTVSLYLTPSPTLSWSDCSSPVSCSEEFLEMILALEQHQGLDRALGEASWADVPWVPVSIPWAIA